LSEKFCLRRSPIFQKGGIGIFYFDNLIFCIKTSFDGDIFFPDLKCLSYYIYQLVVCLPFGRGGFDKSLDCDSPGAIVNNFQGGFFGLRVYMNRYR